jgi:hypothetical protein
MSASINRTNERPIRVLCLHGGGANSNIMKVQLQPLFANTAAADDDASGAATTTRPIEAYYLDGWNLRQLAPELAPHFPNEQGRAYADYEFISDAVASAAKADPSIVRKQRTHKYKNLDASMLRLRTEIVALSDRILAADAAAAATAASATTSSPPTTTKTTATTTTSSTTTPPTFVTHSGACHCGAVAFEVDTPSERIEAHACDCSSRYCDLVFTFCL